MPLDTVATFIGNLRNVKDLHKNLLFAGCVLRLLDQDSTALLFDLLIANVPINSVKTTKNIKESINTLIAYKLIRKMDRRIVLEQDFRQALLDAFCTRNFDFRFVPVGAFDQSAIAVAEKLLVIAEDKMRCVHEAMVANTAVELGGLQDILQYCNLISENGQITNKGFEFLLSTRKDQLWFLVVNSVRYYSASTADEFDLLLRLVEIALKRNGIAFRSTDFIGWYSFLDALGIIHIVEKVADGMVFYTCNTPLFGSHLSTKDEKYIVVETNFKVYAYTDRKYEKSIMALFSTALNVFPGLVRGYFDEASLLQAFSRGITGDQIIKYLQEHSQTVPRNVVNQIMIWEQKQHRIRMRNGYLYHDFIHMSDFQQVVKFVELQGALIFKDEQKRVIVGEEKSHEAVKEFIARIGKR